MKSRKILVALALGIALLVIVGIQLSTDVKAAKPIGCEGVRCFPCPEGQVFAPKPGDCCRCIPQK